MLNIYYHKHDMQTLIAFCVRKTKTTGKNFLILTALIGLIVTPLAAVSATSSSDLQNKINALNEEVKKNQATLDDISGQANTLQNKVDSLNAEINSLQAKIDLASLQIEQTNQQIEITKEKLDKQKKIMYENARTLYKEGDVSTIEILASSDNFSEFVNRQEYLTKVKENVNAAAREVVALKTQLEKKIEDLKNFTIEQKSQQTLIGYRRDEQSTVLAKTRGEEQKYQAIVAGLAAQQAAATAALSASLSSGNYKVAPVGNISAGDVVGAIGNSGLSFGAHTHLEVRVGGSTRNPAPYIKTQPVVPTVITQAYGNPDPIYYSGFHPGVDYGGGVGVPVRAIDSGFMYRGCSNQLLGTNNNAYGYVAIIEHGNGAISIYAHMSGGPAECDYNTAG